MSEPEQAAPRSLRDRPLGRILMLAVVLGAALLAARSCADTTPEVSQSEAVEIALGVARFEPEDHQIRLVRQGTSGAVWAVSLYQGDPRSPTRYQLVLIDTDTGEIVDEDR